MATFVKIRTCRRSTINHESRLYHTMAAFNVNHIVNVWQETWTIGEYGKNEEIKVVGFHIIGGDTFYTDTSFDILIDYLNKGGYENIH